MDPIQQVRSAADRTVEAGTARLTMTTASPAASTTDIEGTVDFTNRRSWARVAMPPMSDDGGTVAVEMIIDGPHLYLEVIGHPGRFVRTRLDAHEDGMPAGDPGLLLDWLRGCIEATPTSDTDPPANDGQLTVLDVVLDLDRAVEAAPEASRRAVRLWIDQMAPDGRPRPARVWLDTHNRVHRLVVREVGGELDVRLTDHAEPIEIPLPDGSALIDPAELQQLLPDLPDLPDPPPDWNSR
jgi:hypothetical protein